MRPVNGAPETAGPGCPPVVEFRGLSVRLGGREILENITMSVPGNTFLAIIGPNGGGKTTLLKTVLGLVKPAAGEALVFGLPPESARRRLAGRIGYLPQTPMFDKSFPASALDVVLMGLYGRLGPGRRAGRLDRARALECLALTGMADAAHRPVGDLSGGQQQRVFIARCLVTGPGLLLLDEPTASIDPAAREQFYALVGQLKQKLGISILLVSHDLVFLPRYCNMVACLNRTVHTHGKPEEVLDGKVLRDTFGCEVDLFVHGKFPHWVAREHDD